MPVALTRAGNLRLSDAGFTKNISSCGVLFTAARELDIGGSYRIRHHSQSTSRSNPVNLKCVGKVVRQMKMNGQSDGADRPVAVAATMERYEFVRSRED